MNVPLANPGNSRPPLALGLTRIQLGIAFLLGVSVYMTCTFVFASTGEFFWGEMTWKDLLTVLAIAAAWIGMAVHNHFHPDEEIRLNLDAGPAHPPPNRDDPR